MDSQYPVYFSKAAKRDLKGLARWVMLNDSSSRAEALLNKLKEACESLIRLPLRGHKLPEYERMSYLNSLEIHHGPYRIIYHLQENKVFIDAVFDGRRDMQEVLSSRLLG